MKSLSLPLRIQKGSVARENDLYRSIESHIAILIMTPVMACAADPGYGFVFNNFRFNIFNENEGVIYDSKPNISYDYEAGMYNRKLSGKSQNINTFAAELKSVVARCETRLKDVRTSMTYLREEKRVYVTVRGTIIETGGDFSYNTTIKAWN